MALSDNIINVESGGDPNASNPNSSASGPGQFIDSTWLATIKAHRPDLAQGQSDANLLTLKTDPVIAKQMVDAYASDNQAILAKNGLPVTPGSTYLAHFAGPQGAVKVLQADPNTPVGDILGPAVVKANPFLQGMTAQGLQAWAAKKMGANVPQPGAQPSPASPPAPAHSPLVTPQQQPIFAQPQAAPSPAPQMAQVQQAQAPQIYFAPRKQIDLSGLQQALAQRMPIFARQDS